MKAETQIPVDKIAEAVASEISKNPTKNTPRDIEKVIAATIDNIDVATPNKPNRNRNRDELNKDTSSPSLRPKQAAHLLGVGLSTLWFLAANRDDFPAPIKISPKLTVFSRDALLKWRDAQKA